MPNVGIKLADGSTAYFNVVSGAGSTGDPYIFSSDRATQTTLAAVLTELALKADLTETQPVSAASLPLPSGAATQTTLAAVLSALQASLTVVLGAGELHLGEVSDPKAISSVTPSLDTSTYADGDLLFDTVAVTAVARNNGGVGNLEGITILDKSNQGGALDLLILNDNQSLGSLNAAPTITATNAEKVVSIIQIGATDWRSLGASLKIATVPFARMPFKAAPGSTSVYLAAISRDTKIYSASALVLTLLSNQ